VTRERKQMQMSFGSMEMDARIRRDSALLKAHALIDWEGLRSQLVGLYKREASRAGGQEPIDPLVMFKAVLLGQWHNLSDPKLEEALRVRIDFMYFCGLSLADDVPDETTLCRFRNRLITAGRLDGLLAGVNSQLQDHGLMVKRAQGAVIDATLVQSAARPKRDMIIELDTKGAPKVNEDGSIPGRTTSKLISCTETQSVDPDATWVKKGKKSHFGYRSYVSVDSGDGYIRGVHTAPANESETTHLQKAVAVCDFKPARVYADKGYASASNRFELRAQRIKSAIMHRAYKNRPLTARQIKANKLIGKTRYIVEQSFGTVKRLFAMGRSRYLGTHKVNAQFMLKAMCMNLLKAANKITLNADTSMRPAGMPERSAR
jgi:IS5 family transposase